MRVVLRASIIVGFLAVWAGSMTGAVADTIEYGFEARVTSATGTFASGGVAVGDTISGTLTYNNAIPQFNSVLDPNVETALVYGTATNTGFLDWAVNVFLPVPATTEVISPNEPGDNPTLFVFNGTAFDGGDGLQFQNTTSDDSTVFYFEELAGALYGSTHAPVGVDLADFDVARFSYIDLNTGAQLVATITSLRPVPEPATLWLLGTSMAAFALGRRRRVERAAADSGPQ